MQQEVQDIWHHAEAHEGSSWSKTCSLLHLCQAGEGGNTHGSSHQICSWETKSIWVSISSNCILKHLIFYPRCKYPGCDFKTRHKDTLLDHETVHTGTKRWCCGTCGKEHRLRYTWFGSRIRIPSIVGYSDLNSFVNLKKFGEPFSLFHKFYCIFLVSIKF